ncbi:MAG: hypothetical protein JSU63_18640 [Phycisphaerales bacterium]|nr:MAG: hypothetical protein JSU63_18640 [Phycisphaerales bacterium]
MRTETTENYRRAAMRLADIARDGGARAALLTSPSRGQGTTTTVLNLARQLHECFGLKTLVVELNRATPSLARRFKLDPAKSIEAIARGKLSVGEAIQEGAAGIGMIVAGTQGNAGEHAVSQGALQMILDDAADDFGFMLVDAPPILSHADALLASKVVPTLILVVQAGRSSWEALDRIRRDLESRDVAIFASILNKHKRFIPGWIYRSIAR